MTIMARSGRSFNCTPTTPEEGKENRGSDGTPSGPLPVPLFFPNRKSFQPVDFDFLVKGLKFWVAGDEFGLLFSGQRGGEGIGQT